jgi:ribosomal RNA-processing protein 1
VTSLHSLQLSVPPALSLPFARTFWLTIATLLPSLDANRLDKFLTLQRRMLHAQLLFLAQHGWREKESRDWIAMIGDAREGPLGVGGDGTKVGDGIRYHVLDILLDEMERVDESETEGVPAWYTEEMKSLVQGQSEKASRGVRKRAEEILEDERWRELRGEGGGENGREAEDEEWSGFED